MSSSSLVSIVTYAPPPGLPSTTLGLICGQEHTWTNACRRMPRQRDRGSSRSQKRIEPHLTCGPFVPSFATSAAVVVSSNELAGSAISRSGCESLTEEESRRCGTFALLSLAAGVSVAAFARPRNQIIGSRPRCGLRSGRRVRPLARPRTGDVQGSVQLIVDNRPGVAIPSAPRSRPRRCRRIHDLPVQHRVARGARALSANSTTIRSAISPCSA
jgi:hypothetical protein